jgi:transglutaminase-like putative cysteine protease
MPVFKIQHITKYEYDRSIKESVNQIKIFPYLCPEQETLQQELDISNQANINTFYDYWGNKTGVFNLIVPHKELVIENKLVVRTIMPAKLEVNFRSNIEQLKNEVSGNLRLLELASSKPASAHGKVEPILREIYHPQRSVAAAVEECSRYIYKNFKYIKGITTVETTVDEILEHQSGVCQDFAHVMLHILRTVGIPCRYVSGYICPNKNGMRGEGATHAWVEAWIPQNGWAGIDPTNNIWVTNNHVKLAVGRDFDDCSPVKGTFKGSAQQRLSVYVSIGYEDGHTFEDSNNVKMTLQPRDYTKDVLDESFAAQQ